MTTTTTITRETNTSTKTSTTKATKEQYAEILERIKNMEKMLEELQDMASVIESGVDDQNLNLTDTQEKLDLALDNMTISARQEATLKEVAKLRMIKLLGPVTGKEYKLKSRRYYINMWDEFKHNFNCGDTWKNLDPRCFDIAKRWIQNWEIAGYQEYYIDKQVVV